MKTNDKNMYGKRTASQVKSILKANGIEVEKIYNMGDGMNFSVMIEDTIKNRWAIKKAGFVLMPGKAGNKAIDIKCC